MRGRASAVLFWIVDLILLTAPFVGGAAWGEAQPPLLGQSDFTYLGAFRLPSGKFGPLGDTFDYSGAFSGGNVYYDPARSSQPTLFIMGHLSNGVSSTQASVAQVTIPEPRDPNLVGLNGLNRASILQGFEDASNGLVGRIAGGGGAGAYTSLVVYNGKLIGTSVSWYDGACAQTQLAFVAPVNLAQKSQATGPYGMSGAVGPRYIGGMSMALIPQEWRSALGGSVVSGSGPMSIISCASPGPALHVIDADKLVSQPASSTVITATPLVYYQDGIHSSLGAWNSNSPSQVINGRRVPSITVTDPYGRGTFTIPYEDNSVTIRGVLFPEGARSVLFFGRKGLGAYCYGGAPSPCPDPDSPYKGDHAYPYTSFVWAYDVNDLVAVKNKRKNPWDILPYTGWAFRTFGTSRGHENVGVSWDSSTRRAYVIVSHSDGTAPLVHVYQVGTGTPGQSGTPANRPVR